MLALQLNIRPNSQTELKTERQKSIFIPFYWRLGYRNLKSGKQNDLLHYCIPHLVGHIPKLVNQTTKTSKQKGDRSGHTAMLGDRCNEMESQFGQMVSRKRKMEGRNGKLDSRNGKLVHQYSFRIKQLRLLDRHLAHLISILSILMQQLRLRIAISGVLIHKPRDLDTLPTDRLYSSATLTALPGKLIVVKWKVRVRIREPGILLAAPASLKTE